MPSFHDVLFPLSLAFGASGGPSRVVEITPLSNGSEHRNAPHARSRRRYNASAGIKSTADMQTLIAFFEARFGQLYSFRFRDPMDHRVEAQIIAIGDGQRTEFQLNKSYSDAAGGYVRDITKPRADSLIVMRDGITVTDYRLDPLTGVITFDAAPGLNSDITASFDFDVPVRFDTAGLELSLEAFGAGLINSIPLLEVFDHA